MKRIRIIFFLSLLHFNLFGQDFNTIINQTADTIAKKIISTGKKRVAITDFINIDQSITQLGVFLSEEISSELSNLTDNQTKFRVLERSNLNQIFKEKNLLNQTEASTLAKELGKIDAADVLGFATITDFDGFFRINIKLLDTKNGDALGSFRTSIIKTSSLENLNKQIVKRATTNTFQKESAPSGNPVEPESRQKGEFCFDNQNNYGYDAIIEIKKNNSSQLLKTITVVEQQTSCAYELDPGIYTITVYWKNGGFTNKTEIKEIKVVSAKSQTLVLKF